MNIGIIVYSHTGNTLAVARKLEEKLKAAGHAVTVEQVTVTDGSSLESGKFELAGRPPVDRYDFLLFGAPVHALSLSAVMKAYLEQLGSLDGKKAACFVTKQLPFSWTGGKQAVNRMKKVCEYRGASVLGTAIVYWTKSRREASIDNCLEDLAGCFLSS